MPDLTPIDFSNSLSVNIGYIFDSEVERAFKQSLVVALNVFVKHVRGGYDPFKGDRDSITKYSNSPDVVEELWHLLDPGAEFFECSALLGAARAQLDWHENEITSSEFDRLILDAWEKFLEAFSFASRSRPRLREFLRASYEVGSFRTLSNFDNTLTDMGTVLKDLEREELAMRQAIAGYTKVLEEYRSWAVAFRAS